MSFSRSRWLRRTYLVLAFVMATTVAVVGPGLTARAAIASYHAVTPQRLLDTRSAFGISSAGKTTPGVPTPIRLPTAASGVAAVVLNLTVIEPADDGFATAYPCGQQPPLASNVNFRGDQTVPNLVIAKPGPDGQVCVVTSVAAHLVVDLQGWFPTGSYDPLPVPERVLDTRTGAKRKLVRRCRDAPRRRPVKRCGRGQRHGGRSRRAGVSHRVSLRHHAPDHVESQLRHRRCRGESRGRPFGRQRRLRGGQRPDPRRCRRAGAYPRGQRIHGDLTGANDRYAVADRGADRRSVAAEPDHRAVVPRDERHPCGRRHRRGQRHRDRFAGKRLPHRVPV